MNINFNYLCQTAIIHTCYLYISILNRIVNIVTSTYILTSYSVINTQEERTKTLSVSDTTYIFTINTFTCQNIHTVIPFNLQLQRKFGLH